MYPLALGHSSDGKISPTDDQRARLFTSANDMARFVLALLNNGKLGDTLNEREVLPPTVVAALSSDSGYGLDADSSRGMRLIRQSSSAAGYASAILMAPDFHTGVVVLVNRDGVSASAVAQKLLETLAAGALPPRRWPSGPITLKLL